MSTSWQVNTLYYITLKYPLEHFVYSCIILFWRIFSSFKKSWHNLLDSEQVASDLKFTRSKIFFAKCGNRRITSSMIAFLLQVISNNSFNSVFRITQKSIFNFSKKLASFQILLFWFNLTNWSERFREFDMIPCASLLTSKVTWNTENRGLQSVSLSHRVTISDHILPQVLYMI